MLSVMTRAEEESLVGDRIENDAERAALVVMHVRRNHRGRH